MDIETIKMIDKVLTAGTVLFIYGIVGYILYRQAAWRRFDKDE